MTDTGSLLEVFGLCCQRCHGLNPDRFEDPAGLELWLDAGRMIPGQARRLPHAAFLRTVRAADLEAYRPVHARCPRPASRREHGKPAYDVLRSVC